MKYLKQLAIILSITLIGEILHHLIPLPVPAGIYGLVLLFVALMTGLLKPEAIRDTAKFLLEIMPILFVPAGVGLLSTWPQLKPILVPLLVIIVVSTIVVMVVSGRVTQLLLKLFRKEKGHE
ncbi:MAG: CidA/LrgA family protein [Lachnospiraceae bacterium]|nr:CidA/LrgA family protein [Lachnospiraceae bacterium]